LAGRDRRRIAGDNVVPATHWIERKSMKREYITTITQRGQVTIPAEVRRLLGANPRDKIAFQVEGDSVRLVPVTLTLEQVSGSVTPLERPENFGERSRAAKEEKAQDAHCVAHMQQAGIDAILSYDTDFDRITEVQRVEP
jgi:antitoxin PrlF